jgi:hypothetical protein
MNAREHVPAVVARAVGGDPGPLAVSERPLRGGLEGAAVTELLVRFRDPRRRSAALRLVAKHLEGPSVREAAVYERLVSRHAASLGPRVLAVVRDLDEAVLYLGAAQRRSGWPWRELTPAARVLEAAAELHADRTAPQDVPAWDYEAALRARGAEALAALERARASPIAASVCSSTAPLRRLVAELPAWRRALLAGPLAPCAIHGDLHTGNVALGPGARPRVVLLDWARARVGSPLEDVCSWLQSLAFWEPAVRRRHDTLLNAYLSARGVAGPASAVVREAYWLAGASNALAGALAFHLDVATSEAPPRRRARSLEAARDWLRIVRRADAAWAGRTARRQRLPSPIGLAPLAP